MMIYFIFLLFLHKQYIFFFIPKIRCTFFLQLNSLSALIQPLEFEWKYFLLIENNLKEIVIQYWTRTLVLQFLHTCMWRKEIPSTSVTTIRTQFCRHCIRQQQLLVTIFFCVQCACSSSTSSPWLINELIACW